MAPAIWGPNVTGGGTAHPYLPPGQRRTPDLQGASSPGRSIATPVIEPNPHGYAVRVCRNAPKAQVVLSRCCPRNSPKVTAS